MITVDSTTMRPDGRTPTLLTDPPDLGIIVQQLAGAIAQAQAALDALLTLHALRPPSLPAIGRRPSPAPDDQALAAPLSPRERQVLRLVATGATNRHVGAALAIEASTVKRHMSTILGKLGARDRAEAAVIACSQRLI
jgi:DNA-binding NarL/FixJ family response regulator